MSSRHRLPRSSADSKKIESSEENTTAAPEATESTDTPPEVTDTPTEVTETPTEVTDTPTEVTETPTEAADVTSEAVEADASEAVAADADSSESPSTDAAPPKRRINWSRVAAYGVLPALALLLAMAAGYLKWQSNADSYTDVSNSNSPAAEAMQVAKTSTIAMLSYQPDSVDQQLNSARDLLTGDFRDSYTGLINDVVIPGAKEQQISAVASVPAAAVVSADQKHAVLLVFVNQTVVVGGGAPTDTASSVRVAMEKEGDRWLIAKFDPV